MSNTALTSINLDLSPIRGRLAEFSKAKIDKKNKELVIDVVNLVNAQNAIIQKELLRFSKMIYLNKESDIESAYKVFIQSIKNDLLNLANTIQFYSIPESSFMIPKLPSGEADQISLDYQVCIGLLEIAAKLRAMAKTDFNPDFRGLRQLRTLYKATRHTDNLIKSRLQKTSRLENEYDIIDKDAQLKNINDIFIKINDATKQLLIGGEQSKSAISEFEKKQVMRNIKLNDLPENANENDLLQIISKIRENIKSPKTITAEQFKKLDIAYRFVNTALSKIQTELHNSTLTDTQRKILNDLIQIINNIREEIIGEIQPDIEQDETTTTNFIEYVETILINHFPFYPKSYSINDLLDAYKNLGRIVDISSNNEHVRNIINKFQNSDLSAMISELKGQLNKPHATILDLPDVGYIARNSNELFKKPDIAYKEEKTQIINSKALQFKNKIISLLNLEVKDYWKKRTYYSPFAMAPKGVARIIECIETHEESDKELIYKLADIAEERITAGKSCSYLFFGIDLRHQDTQKLYQECLDAAYDLKKTEIKKVVLGFSDEPGAS